MSVVEARDERLEGRKIDAAVPPAGAAVPAGSAVVVFDAKSEYGRSSPNSLSEALSPRDFRAVSTAGKEPRHEGRTLRIYCAILALMITGPHALVSG